MLTKKTLGIVAALTSLAAAGLAQTPAHHGILSRIFHRPTRPGTPVTGGAILGRPNPIAGGIIGNTRTHVYHMPGDRGALPAVQNRRYFRTESQALAAGYHRAGSSHGQPGGKMHGHRGSMIPMGAVTRH